ncbi:unnamed protein product [Prorocentrum cordatum]|uniref:Protein-tyrosine sulfotransferase n=1 Tax=Prorocentrum cordatum TaxID=2364126 RepID=A0ABN9XR38_9DINO|nr:unnamed protein product [Polarella glacialis]
MLRKSHLFPLHGTASLRPQALPAGSGVADMLQVPEIRQLARMVWLVRHPLDVVAACRRYKTWSKGINEMYLNMETLAVLLLALAILHPAHCDAIRAASAQGNHFGGGRALVVTYERLCSGTASELLRVLAFVGRPDVQLAAVEAMLAAWPELRCRHANDTVPRRATLEVLSQDHPYHAGGVAGVTRELDSALGVWRRAAQASAEPAAGGVRRPSEL